MPVIQLSGFGPDRQRGKNTACEDLPETLNGILQEISPW